MNDIGESAVAPVVEATVPADEHPGAAPASRRGLGFASACASLLVPGAGQYMAGRRRRGAIWLVLCSGVLAVSILGFVWAELVPVFLLTVPLSLVLQPGCAIDAYLCGRRSRRAWARPLARYGVGAAVLVTAIFAHPGVLLISWTRTHLMEAFSGPSEPSEPGSRYRGPRIDPSGGPMAPILVNADRFVAHKQRELRRWDIVVFEEPSEMNRFVMRLVGLPGEKLEIVKGQLHINDKPVAHPANVQNYSYPPRFEPPRGHEGHPVLLGADEYFMLGDNSTRAFDSRWFGALPGHQPGAITRERIVGVVTWIYWPPARWNKIY